MTDVLVQAIGWSLLAFVWQGAFIGAATALALAVCRKASTRYLVATAGLAIMLAIEGFSVFSRFSEFSRFSAATPAPASSPAPRMRTLVALENPLNLKNLENPENLENPSNLVNPDRVRAFVEPWLPVAVWVWASGVLILSLNVLRGWLSVERILRATQPVAEGWQLRVRDIARRLALHRRVQALESALVDVPAVVGWLRPVLLLPVSTLAGLAPAQVDAIIAHELAHIRRHDYLVNILQSTVETLLFFHPAVWWVSNRIRVEREHCCDDAAVEMCGDRLVYAQALVSLEDLRRTNRTFALAVNDGALLARVRRLVRPSGAEPRSLSASLGSGLALVLMGGAVAGTASLDLPRVEQLGRIWPAHLAQVWPGLAAAPVGAQSPTASPGSVIRAPTQPQPLATGATIKGRVTTVDGRPLRATLVTVYSTPQDNARTRSFYTDNDGRYELTGFPPGIYIVHADRETYVSMDYGETQPQQGGKTLEIRGAETVADVDFRLLRGAVVTGRIVDVHGDPVTEARVRPQRISYANGRLRLMPVDVASTNDLGEFRLYDVAPGSYYITAGASGRVGDATSFRVDDLVRAARRYEETYAPGTTDLTKARVITVKSGDVVGDVVVTLATVNVASVSGLVVDVDGRPAAGAAVDVYRPELRLTDGTAIGAMTRPDGTFTLPRLEPGSYELRARFPGGAAVASISVNGANLTGVRLRPIRIPTLAGRMVVAPEAAARLASGSVKLQWISTDPANTRRWVPDEGVVNPDHSFSMPMLPGRWLLAPALPQGWDVKAVRVRGADTTDAGLAVGEGDDARDVEIELTNRPTRISGTVRDGSGAAANDFNVLVFPRDANRRLDPRARYFAMARPASAGTFAVSGLPAGEYYAVAVAYVHTGDAQNPELLERLSRDAQVFVLQEGDVRSLDLRLKP